MTSKFGRGFVVNLILLAKHLGLPPDQAFFGAADHLDEMVLPEKFRGTGVEQALEHLRKAVIWHQAGFDGQGGLRDRRKRDVPSRHRDRSRGSGSGTPT